MNGWFQRQVLTRRWATFLVLGLAFVLFGASTLNLFFVLRANLSFLLEHGWLAAMDGGAMQLAELVATGYAGMAAYVVFKACEKQLVNWLTDTETPETEEDKT